MNAAIVGRPVGCLKAACRKARFLKTTTRAMATAGALPSADRTSKAFSPQQRSDIQKVSKYTVWPTIPSVLPDPMPLLREQQIAKLDPRGTRTRLFSREHADSAKVGDVLMVTTKTGEPFAGVFLQIRRKGVDTAIQLRGQLMKTSTELWYKIYSPTVKGIDIIWRRPKRARRARLTYMRKPKHDMGSVDQLVFKWKKERYALRSKAAARQSGKQRST